jgi:hypothetical protein
LGEVSTTAGLAELGESFFGAGFGRRAAGPFTAATDFRAGLPVVGSELSSLTEVAGADLGVIVFLAGTERFLGFGFMSRDLNWRRGTQPPRGAWG